MRFLAVFLLFALGIFEPGFAAVSDSQSQVQVSPRLEDYRLGVGDLVRIEVHDEPDLTLDTQIPATGTINYPFLGQLRVAGLTVAQLRDLILQGLRGDYLV